MADSAGLNETARNAPAELKYVICNGHEGEPGAHMDRAIFQGNPHLIIEGLIIGGYAIGGKAGFYLYSSRYAEIEREHRYCLEAAREHGFIGNDIPDLI